MKSDSIQMTKADSGKRMGLLTKKQLAEELSMPLQGVQALTRQKKISAIRLGHKTVRYRLEQVLEDLKKFEIKAIR